MLSHKYIAILGRQPEIGLAELETLLGASGVEPFGYQAAALAEPLDVARLGSVIKVGQILYDGPLTDLRHLPIDEQTLPRTDGKLPFALSVYGYKGSRRMVEQAGLELKKRLKAFGSVRLVLPREGLAVSAAGLKHNQILEKGFELLVIIHQQSMVIAQTLSVQDVDAYAARDYARPARSAKVGMLPPKLAQTLVNLAPGGLVADPFCGTGVVLQEARLLGRPAWGSDASAEMVAATSQNQTWLESHHSNLPAWEAQEADARNVILPEGCSVVSEGYLGPNFAATPQPKQLAGVRVELLDLYRGALSNWAKQLAPGSHLALCVPSWRVGQRWQHLEIVDELPQLGYTLKSFAHVPSLLLYARSDQVVGRRLLLLRKN